MAKRAACLCLYCRCSRRRAAWMKHFIERGGLRQRLWRSRSALVGRAAKAARFRDAVLALGPASVFGAGSMWTANGSWSECQARVGSAAQIRWAASSIGIRGRPLCESVATAPCSRLAGTGCRYRRMCECRYWSLHANGQMDIG